VPAQSRRGTDRFQGRFVGLVAPEDGLCAEFCLSLLDYGLAPCLSKRLKPVYDIHDGQAFLVDVMDEALLTCGRVVLTEWFRRCGRRPGGADGAAYTCRDDHFTEFARFFKRTEGRRAAYGRALCTCAGVSRTRADGKPLVALGACRLAGGSAVCVSHTRAPPLEALSSPGAYLGSELATVRPGWLLRSSA
jgi:hypothetical protein